MISKTTIFELFDNKENKSENDYLDFLNNPYMKVGMFNKIINNNDVFFLKLKKMLNEIYPNKDDSYINSTSKFINFNRAFQYISEIDINNQSHIDALKCHNLNSLLTNIEKVILYFEELEEYEKCSHLLKIKKLVETF
jgi:hypothetical protein